MSLYPRKSIKKYLGIVDVHLIRQIKSIGQEDDVSVLIENVIEEVDEIARSRVEALGGNCLLGYRVDLNTLEQTVHGLYMMFSCFGDVVEVGESDKEIF
jgi:uncharacterized protein YbjQ (UPF0145 family)